ncbi:MAG: DNA-binding protein WhiA [Eubacteriales bacterium]
MSFSSKIKDDLCHAQEETRKAAIAELFALISTAGNITLSAGGMALKIHFEYLPVAKRTYQLLNRYFAIDCEIDVTQNKMKKKNSYSLVIEGKETVLDLLCGLGFPEEKALFLFHTPPVSMIDRTANRTAFLRGLFLGCGTISNPQKNYHMEFVLSNKDFATCILNILKKLKIIAKIVTRKSNYVVYLKSGDDIANLLAAIGAHSAVLELENIRILKDMRNNVNRAVNCETANISKTVDAAVRQLKAIQLIDDTIGLGQLNESLAEAAMLRLSNPEASLNELAELSATHSTKSGFNHRFRKLIKIADELLSKEDLS